MHWDRRWMAYALLRTTVGFAFLCYGVGKFLGGAGTFARGLESNFAKSWLPGPLVYGFGLLLPFLEVLTGVLLVLGLFTLFGTILGGLLVLLLTIGVAVAGQAQLVAQNLIYALVFWVLLYYMDENGLSADAVMRGNRR